MLEVRLLGTFSIQCSGKPVALSSRAAQSLFAYLILTAGTLHRREKLAGMFWPEASEEKARAYLRHELWRIRKAITADAFLVSDELGIGYNASAPYWLDAEVLKTFKDTTTVDELIAALSTYQGELLPGFYDEWVVLEREHLQSKFEQRMARLLELLESEKRWSDILEWAERWISFGQGTEAAYRYLMVACDALGDRAKVASNYERCVQALRELDLEPSEQTRILAFKRTSKLNIPIPLTSFIGREDELKEVGQLLSKSRLVTLTGSGGVGKTRLAIQAVGNVLESFPDGAWFLDLAPVSDPALVPSTLAEVLDLHVMGGSNLSVTDLISSYLGSRKALLIVDNCEHLIEPCAQLVHSLLTACENLSILATSREALRITGEIPYRVPSLALPRWDLDPSVDALAKTEAMRLFIERAAILSPGFGITPQNALAIARICQRLDGIPLAIELAAARINLLTVEQILSRLDDRFNLLNAGLRSALPRHRTLRATIEWSYDLLSEKERLLFQRLAVFNGGWTLEAAEDVCSDSRIETSEVLDLISQLVDKSLVQVENSPSSVKALRYRRLETIRQFACEKLSETTEAIQMHRNHVLYYSHLDSIHEDELDNLRSVFSWCLETGEAEPALRLAGDFFFWEKRVAEGLQWISQVLALPGAQAQTRERGNALYSAAVLSYFHGNYPAAQVFSEDLFRLSHKLNDVSLIWLQKFIHATLIASGGDYQAGLDIFEEARTTENPFRFALSTLAMASCELLLHTFDWARHHADEARQIFDELDRKNYLVDCDMILGYIALEEGDLPTAWKHFRQGIQVAVSNSVQQRLGAIFAGLGCVAFQAGDLAGAARWFGVAEMVIITTGYHARAFPEPISQRYLAQVRLMLDPHAFQSAWEDGRAMTVEQAIEYALKELR